MTVFAFGAGLLALSFVTHLIIWRIRLPHNHTLALLVIFLVMPVVALAALYVIAPEILAIDWARWTLIALVYAPCALTYIALYSMLEHRSPTLDIIEYIEKSVGKRIALADLQRMAAADSVLGSRLTQFEQGGVVRRDRDSLTVTGSGAMLAFAFSFAANLLGVRRGG